VRRGRGDQRGAFHLAGFIFFVIAGLWILSPHVNDTSQEQNRLFVALGMSFFLGAVMYVLYLGFEPFVRRTWPDMLVGWTRVVSGRIRDPLVGRDVLIGVTCGAGLALMFFSRIVIPPMLGLPDPMPYETEFPPLFGMRGALITLFGCVNISMQNMLITTFEFAGFRAVIERVTRKLFGWTSERLFIALAVAALAIVSAVGNSGNDRFVDALYQAVSLTVALHVLLHFGIFAATVMFLARFVLLRFSFSFDSSALYAASGWFALALLLGLAAIGYWMATHPRREAWRSI